jgi:Flp pilus assembly protein TadD
MKDAGLFSLDYTHRETRTARAAFHERMGNCLSFTLLFVALAREAGLDARFQIVDVPPTWVNESDVVVVGNHINALVELPQGDRFVVDFNALDPRSKFAEHPVADEYAIALFYNNLGAEALLRKEYDLSFQYFREALVTSPNVAGAWANLGVLYAKSDVPAHAEAAYLQALTTGPGNRTALTNLASLYESIGELELAAEYRERIRNYQQRNPYYHYARARSAFNERRFEDALTAVKRAVRLKGDEAEFYDLKARAHLELGERPRAADSFVRARDYADSLEMRAKYEARLRSLAGGS